LYLPHFCHTAIVCSRAISRSRKIAEIDIDQHSLCNYTYVQAERQASLPNNVQRVSNVIPCGNPANDTAPANPDLSRRLGLADQL
jgi:hypothetical protein